MYLIDALENYTITWLWFDQIDSSQQMSLAHYAHRLQSRNPTRYNPSYLHAWVMWKSKFGKLK